VSDFLTQQQQRRRFTRVAVVESEESRGAFSFSNTREKFVFEQKSEISGYNKHTVFNTSFTRCSIYYYSYYYCYAVVILLLNY
jgi:hypothetical protein